MSDDESGLPRPPRRHGAVLEEMLEALDAAGPTYAEGAFAARVREGRGMRFDDEPPALAERLRGALIVEAHRFGPGLVERLAGLVEQLHAATRAVRRRPAWAKADARPERRGVSDDPRYRRALFASGLAHARARGRTTEQEAEFHDMTPGQVAEAERGLPNLAASETTDRRLMQIRRAVGADGRRDDLALERGAARIGATPEEEDAIREHRGYAIPPGRLVELRDRALALADEPEALACRGGQADGEPVFAGTEMRLSSLFADLVRGVSLRTWLLDHPDVAPERPVRALARAFALLRDDALQASDLPEAERRHAAATGDWLFEAAARDVPATPPGQAEAARVAARPGDAAGGPTDRPTPEDDDAASGFDAGLRHLVLHLCERRGRPLREPWQTRLRRHRGTAVLEALFDVLDATGEEAVVAAAFAAADRVRGPADRRARLGSPSGSATSQAMIARAEAAAESGAKPASTAPEGSDEGARRRIAWVVDGHLGLPPGTTDPGVLEILAYAPLLHSGWECDSDAALVRLPGEDAPTAVIYAGTSATRPLSAYLRSLLPTYVDALVRGAHLAAALEREGL